MIPHYHLIEATAAFRSKFPDLVRRNDDSIIPSFLHQFRIFSKQHIIDDDLDMFEYTEM